MRKRWLPATLTYAGSAVLPSPSLALLFFDTEAKVEVELGVRYEKTQTFRRLEDALVNSIVCAFSPKRNSLLPESSISDEK